MRRSQAMLDDGLEQRGVRLIPAQFVQEAVAAARLHGADWEALLRSAQISPTLNRPVHIEQFARLWKDVGREINDDFLHLGARSLPSGALGFLAHGVVNTPTFHDATVRALDYLRILIDWPRARFEVNGDLAEVVFCDAEEPLPPFAYHLLWIIIGGLTGWLVGRRVALRLVDFACPEPSTGAAYRDMMRAPVRFSRQTTRFVFGAEYLGLPVIRQHDSLDVFLAQLPGILLMRHWDEGTLSSAIRRKLGLLCPAKWPTFEQLAADMNMPTSSLRRKLRVEGHSYLAIKDDIRRARAVQALLHSELSVEMIAEMLGFAEASAFYRAFNKWVSCSPGAFRRNNVAAR